MPRARRRILFLTNRLNPAGAETFLLHRTRQIDRDRYDPIVGVLHDGGELAPAFEAAGVETISFGLRHRLDPAGLRRMHHFLRERRVDILETHVVMSCILGRVIGTVARTPRIVSNVQDVRTGADGVRPAVRYLSDLTCPFVDAFVHITRAVERVFRSGTPRVLLPRRALHRVIPNGIDVDGVRAVARSVDTREKRDALGLPRDAFVIGNVARLHPSKGQRHLIDAFAELHRERPDARLVLVGWGVEEQALRARAQELGVSPFVSLLGKRLDVYELLPCFDVFAFPSIHEAQGIALLEAMAVGVPVVAADVDGIPESVRPGESGLLVRPGSATDLAVAIRRFWQEPELAPALVSGATKVVENEYSIRHSAHLYDELYQSLLRERPRAAA